MGVRYIFSNTCSNIMKFLCKTGVFYPSSKKKKTNIFINVANKYLLLGVGGGQQRGGGVEWCHLVVLA